MFIITTVFYLFFAAGTTLCHSPPIICRRQLWTNSEGKKFLYVTKHYSAAISTASTQTVYVVHVVGTDVLPTANTKASRLHISHKHCDPSCQ